MRRLNSREIPLTNKCSGPTTAFRALRVRKEKIVIIGTHAFSGQFEIFVPGANFHPSLTQPKKSQVIQKGTNPQIDAYSAFFDNTDIKDSGDTGLKDLVRDSTEIVVVGLAQDYCVAWTALDSLQVSQGTLFVSCFSLLYFSDITRRGWCPRTVLRAAVNDYIWLAACQNKIYEK